MWENSKMWPFSCFAFTKEGQCLPGELWRGSASRVS